MARVTQIAMLEPKADISAEQLKKIIDEALALKDDCLHPETKQPYLQSVVGGKGNIFNPAAGSRGNDTLTFVVEFADEEDQKFFNEKDVAHAAFIQNNTEHMAQTQVLAFAQGVY